MDKKILTYLVLFFSFVSPLKGVELKGTVNYAEGWQPVVFLASLDSPEELFVASPDFILSKTLINPDGSFSFDDVVLPSDPRFYRIYMVRSELSSVEFNASGNRNFIHLILDNKSIVSIDLSVEDDRLEVLDMKGSGRNRSVLGFDREYEKQKAKLNTGLSKAQSDFLKIQIDRFVKIFTDTVSWPMAGLYALYHIDEKETDFLRNSKFYFDFQKKIHNAYPNTIYTQKYDELLNSLVGFRDLVCEIPGVAPRWKDYVMIVQAAIILILILIILFVVFYRKKRYNKVDGSNILDNLTGKEMEILKQMSEGKTNKEIAGALFIELSTVKTHINRIYKQLKVRSRQEAIKIFEGIISDGGRGA